MENIRKRVDMTLVKTDVSQNGKLRKLISKPNFKGRQKISDELSSIRCVRQNSH